MNGGCCLWRELSIARGGVSNLNTIFDFMAPLRVIGTADLVWLSMPCHDEDRGHAFPDLLAFSTTQRSTQEDR